MREWYLKKYVSKICLPCLVSEIELFVYIFGQKLNGRKRSEKEKGRPSSFLLFPTHKYYNLTKFRHNQIKKKILLIAHFL